VRRLLRLYCPQGGQLVDVGCGLGEFLRTLGSEWNLTGIEPAAAACEHVRRTVPRAQILQGDILTIARPGKQFHGATLLASLEHMPDPASALRRIGEMLAGGGLIIVRVPYVEWYLKVKRLVSWLPIRFGAPRHLYDFSPRTLSLILERNGYRVVRIYVGSRERTSSSMVAAAVTAIKGLSKTLYYASGRRYILPLCGSIVAVAQREGGSPVVPSPPENRSRLHK
jgi:SAM-dependent methyltransferase